MRISDFRFQISDFRSWSALLVLIFACVASSEGQIAMGGSYVLEKSVVAAGGASGAGASTNGVYTVEGAIGQFGVSAASQNAPYTLNPGFWTPAPLAPTAANVTIGGRILAANGGAIRNVQVLLTMPGGETRVAATNTFGYYRFADVPVGETYVVTVYSKRYVFAAPTQIVTVFEAREDIDFIAEKF